MNLRHAPVVQAVKSHMVRMGPRSPAVKTMLKARARLSGFRLGFSAGAISIVRGKREIDLPLSHYVEVPITMECFDEFFRSLVPEDRMGRAVLDFSEPGLQTYRRGGMEFYFPGLPEEDSMAAYEHWHKPGPGETVWDVGAHAGATTYCLSQAVGPTGRVYAFEPDEVSYAFLLKNIAMHGMTNVVPVKKALSRRSGRVVFQSDGSVAAGIREFLLYSERGSSVEVEAISLEDACCAFGSVPTYIKMDIEGAEVAVVEGAAEFLRENPIHFAIESYHPLADGQLTYKALDRIFPTIEYAVQSSREFGQMFTWAKAVKPGRGSGA